MQEDKNGDTPKWFLITASPHCSLAQVVSQQCRKRLVGCQSLPGQKTTGKTTDVPQVVGRWLLVLGCWLFLLLLLLLLSLSLSLWLLLLLLLAVIVLVIVLVVVVDVDVVVVVVVVAGGGGGGDGGVVVVVVVGGNARTTIQDSSLCSFVVIIFHVHLDCAPQEC